MCRYEDAAVLLFPSVYQHLLFETGLADNSGGHNDGIIDIRFAAQHRTTDPKAHYSSANNGRSSFVPVAPNHCESLHVSRGQPAFNWCQSQAWAYANTPAGTGTNYMATGYILSEDGAQVYLYSGAMSSSHGALGLSALHNIGDGDQSIVQRHVLRRDGFVFAEAGYAGATSHCSTWPYLLTHALAVPDASACFSGKLGLRVNVETGVGGAAFFELSQGGTPLAGFGLNDSIMVKGNWISARVGWEAAANYSTGLTRFSGGSVQVKVAMRDARLFSLSVGCERTPITTRCLDGRDGSCATAFGAEYNTVPCERHADCAVYGPCSNSPLGGVLPVCDEASQLCVVPSGGNQTICGRYIG